MAKTGSIVGTAGSQAGFAAVVGVAQSEPRVSNLASVARDGLVALTSGLGIGIIDLANRRAHVTLDVTGVRDAWADAVQAEQIILSKAEEGSSVPFNVTSGAFSAIEDELAPAPPRYSVATLISMIEEVLEAEGKSALIMIDQANSIVRVEIGTPAAVNTAGDALETALAASSGALRLAKFDQTVDESTGPKPFGE